MKNKISNFELIVWSLIGILLGWAIYSLTVGSFDWSAFIATLAGSFVGIFFGMWKLRKQETERVIAITKNMFLWFFLGSYLILFTALVIFKYFLHMSSVPVDWLIIYVAFVIIVIYFLLSFIKR